MSSHVLTFLRPARGRRHPGGGRVGPATETRPVPMTTAGLTRVPRQAVQLAPDDPFPEDLLELPLERLQILHSRICRQVDVENLRPEGPHPITLDRLLEVQVELESRSLA